MSMKILCEPTKTIHNWPEFTPIRAWSIRQRIYDENKFLYKRWFELSPEDAVRNYGVSFLIGTLLTVEFDSEKESETFAVIDKLIS